MRSVKHAVAVFLCFAVSPAWAQKAIIAKRPLVVVLPPQADAQVMRPDVAQFAGMLQGELTSTAKYADVLIIADAAANAGVKDTKVIGCSQPACALDAARAVGARYVVTTQFTLVGKERVINVRILDVDNGRLLGMQSDKAEFDDESLPPVAARASLRLAAAAHLDKAQETPVERPEPAPTPEAVKPRTFDAPPADDDLLGVIVVPAAPQPASQPAAAPRTDTPPSPVQTNLQANTDTLPDPNKLPAYAPTVKEASGRKVNWPTRITIILVGVLLGGWAPLMIPAGIVGSTTFILRAVELRTRLQQRPHKTEEISSMVQEGRIYEASAYAMAAGALGLFLVGLTVLTTCVVVALVLP